MGNTDNRMASADALVIFGVTGDLCHKMIFPALYAMARRGVLNVPQRLFDDSLPAAGRANYLRFRLSPNTAVALAARVKRAGKEFVGDQRELYLSEEQPGVETPFERLLSDAMAGNGALFTREDAVEAAWTVVAPVLDKHNPVHPYKPGSWGPKQADALIAADGGWHNPALVKVAK